MDCCIFLTLRSRGLSYCLAVFLNWDLVFFTGLFLSIVNELDFV